MRLHRYLVQVHCAVSDRDGAARYHYPAHQCLSRPQARCTLRPFFFLCSLTGLCTSPLSGPPRLHFPCALYPFCVFTTSSPATQTSFASYNFAHSRWLHKYFRPSLYILLPLSYPHHPAVLMLNPTTGRIPLFHSCNLIPLLLFSSTRNISGYPDLIYMMGPRAANSWAKWCH